MLSLSEIFCSLQGESTFAGLPCVFVRLAGCNLSCAYCDTGYAARKSDGVEITLAEIVDRVAVYRVPLVEVTGGEPLLQGQTPELVRSLLDLGYTVLVETNGSLDISSLDLRAHLIVDVKTPGSGMVDSFHQPNLACLQPHHQIKFVLVDAADFFWSLDFIKQHLIFLAGKEIIFSPVVASFQPAELAGLILQHRVRVRLQLQLHTLLWPASERGR
ncbi:MAG: radical SAM protein [Deltaproteobacteria bacterium]|nr:radical SAM protein [Deltaproteobacteria bacterium]